jgi:hypothetical protein
VTKEQTMLLKSLEACRQRIEKLDYSIQKNAVLFPIDQQVSTGAEKR